MKACFVCKEEKPLTDFYKHPRMSDGRVGKCKECNKSDVRANRAKKIEYYREYDKSRANNPDRVAARLEYAQSEDGKASGNRAKRSWSERNRIKSGASIIIGNAVRDGRVIRPDECEVCFVIPPRLHGHHDDYAYPLIVRWLCSKCHKAWHKENGQGANG